MAIENHKSDRTESQLDLRQASRPVDVLSVDKLVEDQFERQLLRRGGQHRVNDVLVESFPNSQMLQRRWPGYIFDAPVKLQIERQLLQ